MAALKKNEKLEIMHADIFAIDAVALVNPTNTDLLLGAGIAGEIRKKAGSQVQEDCLEIGTIGIGSSTVTPGCKLKAKHIIHAATMKIGGVTTENNLINSIASISKRINEHKIASVVFPPMGIGVGRFPLRRCAEVMIITILQKIVTKKCLEQVIIVLPDEEMCDLFEETYNRITNGQPNRAEVNS